MTKGFVYLIAESDGDSGTPTGFYKIGKTKNPDQRIRTFRTASKNGLEFVRLIEVDDYSKAEAAVHRSLARFRMLGKNAGKEWFDLRETGPGVAHVAMVAEASRFSTRPSKVDGFSSLDEVDLVADRGHAQLFSFSGCLQYVFALALVLGLFVSISERTETQSIAESDSSIVRVRVGDGGSAIVFDSPYAGQQQVGAILGGNEVAVTAKEGGWLLTEYGWVHDSQVQR